MRRYSAPMLLLFALALRALAAWWLGPGPFGPDGAGAEAAVVLGGHPYPLHPALIQTLGDARLLSVLGGVLAAWSVGRMGELLGARASGVLAACAPLLLLTSAMAGGDSAAAGAAGAGLALAWSGHPLVGGLLAASSIAIKPVALPILPLVLLCGLFPGGPRFASLRALAGLLGGSLPWLSTLDPLLRPRPHAGLLGSWWRSTQDLPPAWGSFLDLGHAALGALAGLPLWTGLHALLLLAILGLVRTEHRKLPAIVLIFSLLALVAPAALLGDQLRPRYLAAASLPLTAVAGLGLRSLWPLAMALLWPAAAFISQLAALRAGEEGLPQRPTLPWPAAMDTREAYRDAGVCGAGELREMAAKLAESLPQGATVTVLRLRDGREGELRWPLLARRPDLQIALIHAGNCPDGACVPSLEGPVVYAADTSRCATEVLDPGEVPIAAELAERFGVWGGVYGLHN